jgi:hypothetical protein
MIGIALLALLVLGLVGLVLYFVGIYAFAGSLRLGKRQ